MRKTALKRIYAIIFFFACIVCVFVYRLYVLQIRDHGIWVERAESQYVVTEKGIFKRGTIYASPRTGSPLPIATTESGYILAIDYRELKNPDDAFVSLSKVLPSLDREQFFKYTQGPLGWRELDKRVSEERAGTIDALHIPGVHMVKTQWRVYPYGDVMARTIGFVGASDSDSTLRGKYGLELAYDDNLIRASDAKTVNFFAELFGDFTSGTTTKNTAEEADVVTTLEPVVSHMLQRELVTVQKTYSSEITGGIIMNPRTGEVYAMDAVPSYDLNDRRGVPQDYFVNPNTRSLFEFGSIMKPLTVAMGIDAGVVGRNTTYEDTGCTTLNTLKICNWDGRARGVTTIQNALNESLNMGMVFVQQLLGKDRFRTYVENLQLGNATGINAGGDSPGIINNLKQKRDIEYATASYGQGIAMTPMAMARALSTLANNGAVPSPRIEKSLRFADGTEALVARPPGEQVFAPQTTETVSRMLTEVVDTALRHGAVKLEHTSVAAKTGTAFLAGENGGYNHDKFFHSIFSYFPSYDPQFLILLYTKDPKNVQYASETLTDALMSLTKELISYYEIPPDR